MKITIKKIKKLIFDRNYRWLLFRDFGCFDSMSDEAYLKRMFEIMMGYELNLDNPQTYNEKLQWLKLYDHNPIYTTMVDKYAVKDYVSSIIGEEYIIPTLGVWDKFDDIDFEALPNQFVLKCTHDSGGLVICKDKSKFDINVARKKINKSLKRNFYYYGREWPYKDVKPRIIAEKYMEDNSENLNDYKFMCFDGKVKASFVCNNRYEKNGLTVTFYDTEWKRMPFERHYPASVYEIDKSKSYKEMVRIAEQLAKKISFVRVDFYEIKGKPYFGELTFFPGSGFEEFVPKERDNLFGDWIELPKDCGGGYLICNVGYVLWAHEKVVQDAVENKIKETPPLRDYKIYTFNGKAKMCMINQDRGHHTRADYFDKDYNWLDFKWGYDHAEIPPVKPKNYEKMFELAEKLAVGTVELRVDFYEIDGKIFFGELTFFDGSGYDKIEPKSYDEMFGLWLRLPNMEESL